MAAEGDLTSEMKEAITRQMMEKFTVVSTMNQEGDVLPFGYFSPESEGKVTWTCNYDQEGRITSVFCYDYGGPNQEQIPQYLENIEKAIYFRDELVKNGWQKTKPPEITFTFPGEDEPRTLNRKQKRYLKQTVDKMKKHNPFDE